MNLNSYFYVITYVLYSRPRFPTKKIPQGDPYSGYTSVVTVRFYLKSGRIMAKDSLYGNDYIHRT